MAQHCANPRYGMSCVPQIPYAHRPNHMSPLTTGPYSRQNPYTIPASGISPKAPCRSEAKLLPRFHYSNRRSCNYYRSQQTWPSYCSTKPIEQNSNMRYKSDVGCSGLHGLSCLKNSGRFSRHVMINDIIKRVLISAGFPTILEPNGVNRSDGKRPDGLTLTPWSKSKTLLWDVTCYNTFASSYLSKTSKLPGSAVASAVAIKRNKYLDLLDRYNFVVFAVESMGPWCSVAKLLTSDIGKYLSALNGDSRPTAFLRQKISIAIQRGNAIFCVIIRRKSNGTEKNSLRRRDLNPGFQLYVLRLREYTSHCLDGNVAKKFNGHGMDVLSRILTDVMRTKRTPFIINGYSSSF
ncbi:hypothetical protein ANN_07694 [Periplaneta americana]|uniref:Uncharacterized protein n=1 Tax=Periplaneta americana TaxID=6978 RepID=A0ABQ8T0X0_PERAM|nr:hypothetical protein ANN_07694 [Periplaneta americana]